jgi:hypothetical protein
MAARAGIPTLLSLYRLFVTPSTGIVNDKAPALGNRNDCVRGAPASPADLYVAL